MNNKLLNKKSRLLTWQDNFNGKDYSLNYNSRIISDKEGFLSPYITVKKQRKEENETHQTVRRFLNHGR